MILAPGLAFTLLSSADERSHSRPRLLPMVQATKGEIEFQSDESNYGRGEMHLSAVLDIGDVVVYQTGTWLVDGVQVGDGSPPKYEYGLVETIQLVWTHNCEHGVIRALPLALLEDGEAQVLRIEEEECIEFGPEQLVAKLPLQWDEGASEATVESPLELSEELWEPMAS
ncbi:expressed unknown protein [Seminavis robusta]|uniref:Uncharacterized protein n=1 Tax=Seminavis robusta TaxID=568900 RepID=A0A9N8HN76_9STRA|nr:expressed unknown protein [Seminavis robusta]|eukprot:Sro964_g225460.1 n/a (170) ;mRNA; f:18704-19213